MSEIGPKSTREERLAAKLRENLKRRKAQARAIMADDSSQSSTAQDALSKGAEDR